MSFLKSDSVVVNINVLFIVQINVNKLRDSNKKGACYQSKSSSVMNLLPANSIGVEMIFT